MPRQDVFWCVSDSKRHGLHCWLEYGPYGITVFVLLTRRKTRSVFNAPMKTFRLDQVGFSQRWHTDSASFQANPRSIYRFGIEMCLALCRTTMEDSQAGVLVAAEESTTNLSKSQQPWNILKQLHLDRKSIQPVQWTGPKYFVAFKVFIFAPGCA